MKKNIQLLFFGLNIIFSQTDQQIQKAKNIIKTNNISEQQVIKVAKSKGFTDKQIKKVLEKDGRSSTNSSIEINEQQIDSRIEKEINSPKEVSSFDITEQKKENNSSQTKNRIKKRDIQYFGYNIFKKDPSLFQSTSFGAVDPNYLIGPGDEIIIMLWGETQFRQVYKVDIEGFLFIPEIGQVFVNGLDLSLL